MKSRFHEVFDSFSSKKILVIGDFILDVYLRGFSDRLSPEAPVPVVDVTDQQYVAGGAGNAACNLRDLGAEVLFFAVVGKDFEGDIANNLLTQKHIDTSTLVVSENRKTICKTRIISGHQPITRFDTGTQMELDHTSESLIIDYLTLAYQSCDAILISDYDKGTVTENILDCIIRLQKRWPKFIAVDSKRLAYFKKIHPHLVKPNYEEITKLLGIPKIPTEHFSQIIDHGPEIYETTNADIVAVTLDREGSAIFELGQFIHRTIAPAISFPDVAGAGDTYLSAFLLSYLMTADPKVSADIANAASTVAIRKQGTSSCTCSELRHFFGVAGKVINNYEELQWRCEQYREQGKRIVFTNGCFDILHSGHVTYLHCAKELGDVLIVGVNQDESIHRLKGETRPINPLEDRLQVLSALASVDHLFAFGDETDDTPISVIKVVKPDVFAKGGDYTKEKLPEAEVVESLGGQIVFLPHIPDHSTTSIIKRISTTATSDQAAFFNSGHE